MEVLMLGQDEFCPFCIGKLIEGKLGEVEGYKHPNKPCKRFRFGTFISKEDLQRFKDRSGKYIGASPASHSSRDA
jgi:hypothetical protein